MKHWLKKCASHLPHSVQQELKRRYFGRQIRCHSFRTGEAEFGLLHELLSAGDWVIDIGANIGHYALRMSEIVGEGGRVIAFEPMPETFELLTANARLGGFQNFTLINAAASDATRLNGMVTHVFEETGLDDLYTAELVPANKTGSVRVLCLTVDSLALPQPVALVKIDAEGHELPVLKGMQELLTRDHPILIVEDNDPDVPRFLRGFGYACNKIEGSPNRIYRALA